MTYKLKNNIGEVSADKIEEITEKVSKLEKFSSAEEKYRIVVENACEAIIVAQDGKICFANPKTVELTGFSEEELKTRPFTEFIHPEDRELVFRRYKERLSSKNPPEKYEFRLVDKDGNTKWVEIHSVRIEWNGKSAVLCFLSEITKRKKAEEELEKYRSNLEKMVEERTKELKENEEKFRILAEESPSMIFINQDGKIVYANRKCEEVMGYTLDELQSDDFSFNDLIAPESLRFIEKNFKKHMNSEEIKPTEYTLLTKNGRRIEALITTRLVNYKGKKAILGIVTDISERKAIENKLEKSVSLLRATLESTGDGILVVDSKGKILDYNQKFVRMWNLPEHILESRSEKDMLSYVLDQIRDPESFMKRFSEINSGKEVIVKDYIEFKDGRMFRRYSQPMRIGSKNAGRVWSFRDVTERKQMEKALIQLNEVLRLINKNLRHDLINDLTIVSNSIEMYFEMRDDKLLENSLNSIRKGIRLIKRMKELESLISSGGKLKPCNLRDVIEDVIKNYSISFNIKGDCTVIADEALSSLIDNIIGNAVKHGNADKIDIEIETKEDFCEIRIADNGTGVPDEIKEEIFDEGFTYGEKRGTGLGLYIVKKTVERYGGYIHVEDNEPSGAVFILGLKPISDYSGIRSRLGIPVINSHSRQQTGIEMNKREERNGRIEEVELDLKGLKCPQPILRIHSRALKLPKGSIIKVVADCPTFERDLSIWAAKTGKTVLECVNTDNIWRAHIIV